MWWRWGKKKKKKKKYMEHGNAEVRRTKTV